MHFRTEFVKKELNGKRICYEIEKVKEDKKILFFYNYDNSQFPDLSGIKNRMENHFTGLRIKCIFAEMLFNELIEAKEIGTKSRYFDDTDILMVFDLQYFIWEQYDIQDAFLEGLIKLSDGGKQIIMTGSLEYDKINYLTEDTRAFLKEAVSMNTKSILCGKDMQRFICPQYSQEELLCLDVNIDHYIVLKKYYCKKREMVLLSKLLKEYKEVIPNREYEEILISAEEKQTQKERENLHRVCKEYLEKIKAEIHRMEFMGENLYKTFIEPLSLKIAVEIDGIVYVVLSTNNSNEICGRYIEKKYGIIMKEYWAKYMGQEVLVKIM